MKLYRALNFQLTKFMAKSPFGTGIEGLKRLRVAFSRGNGFPFTSLDPMVPGGLAKVRVLGLDPLIEARPLHGLATDEALIFDHHDGGEGTRPSLLGHIGSGILLCCVPCFLGSAFIRGTFQT